jgi:hypothetical protein
MKQAYIISRGTEEFCVGPRAVCVDRGSVAVGGGVGQWNMAKWKGVDPPLRLESMS